jgi:hypothetical protein
MANTTNYNWETPDDTDLVKDGALAIRTLGSSVDTTTKALNPSTTLGDIEYRSATANTNTRLAIGSTGQVLTVAAGVPSWASAPAATVTARGCSLTKGGSNQSLANATLTSVTFEAEQFDTNAYHDNSTNNSRITIPAGYAGKYQINGSILFAANSTGDRELYFFINNSANYNYTVTKATSSLMGLQGGVILNLAEGDYVEIKVYQDSGTNVNVLSGVNSTFSIGYLGA